MSSPIPILDLERLATDRMAFVTEVGSALQDFGFVGVRGHRIAEDVIARALATAREFFALPMAVKRGYEVPGGAGQRGHTHFGVEKARDQAHPDLKEFWHVGREVPRDDPLAAVLLPNLWPAEVPGFRAAQLTLFQALEHVGAQLLTAIALWLDLEEHWFAHKIERGNSILRPLHYPPIAAGVNSVRAAAHEDINLITLLVGSTEPGLEILARDGNWISITTLPGTLVCNVGDMLQRLTNHRLRSTTHRVVNPPEPWSSRSRYSIPFFLHFNPDVVIATLAGCCTEAAPNRYPTAIVADDLLRERLREIGLV